MPTTTPARRQHAFLSPRDDWEGRRDQGIPPLFHSGFEGTADTRAEFLRGGELIGYGDGEDQRPYAPQQLAIADTIAGHRRTYVVEVPRRSAKTTSIFTALLGRCATRPNYLVTYTAQNGVAGMMQFLEWVTDLDRFTPPDDDDLPPWLRGKHRAPKHVQRQIALFGEELGDLEAELHPTSGRGFKYLKGMVNTGIFFDNGSVFRHIGPSPRNFRGRAADVAWIDEAQEVPVEDGGAMLAAIRPLQDTRPGASIIVSGTAGEQRAGVFWDLVERGRAGDPDVGIIDYAAPPNTEWAVVEDQDKALQLLERVHPGIGTLTTLEVMRDQWKNMPRPQWAREYLQLWPESASSRAIRSDLWDSAKITRRPPLPDPAKDQVAFAFAIKPGGSVSAIAAAWRTPAGLGYLEVLEHRPGTDWLPKRLQELSVKYRRSTIAYDDTTDTRATRTELERMVPAPKLAPPIRWQELGAGCTQVLRDLERGTVRHFGQVSLDTAVANAGKRQVKDDRAVWFWTPVQRTADITPLDAATWALRSWDLHMDRRSRRPRAAIITARPSA